MMFRKALIDLLQDNPMSLADIAQLMESTHKEVEDDLMHLQKSLKHSDYRLIIHPATCRKCGFRFKKSKMHKPGKCPQCHETWIKDPLLEVKRG
jgi:predicted Zn-ribbon and HTH transcriptional regulator